MGQGSKALSRLLAGCIRTSIVAIVALAPAHGAGATSLLVGSFAINIADGNPFGPFPKNEIVQLRATVKNASSDQTITICEHICIGDTNTYSVGGFASTPIGYSFAWGTGGDTSLGWLNGQIAGALLPNEEKVFVFSTYTPTASLNVGFVGFVAQLQIFAATEARPFLSGPSIGGRWEVIDSVPEPGTLVLLGLGLASLGLSRRRKAN